ncbi:Origin recognition complex, subunit 3 [Phytophthora cactorum]|nr:Origin recognition complex, subunit 3 [Phytophthora cactorum]
METAAFSTGVSIQYPFGDRQLISLQYPFPFPVDSKTPSERQYRADTETYSVCQELAYQLRLREDTSAVQELLRKSNGTSYTGAEVLREILRAHQRAKAHDDTGVDDQEDDKDKDYQSDDSFFDSSSESESRFVVGVASATSPALRRLDLTVTNRLELQFFSLVDSRKCFDDVLESLVVKAKLPLALSGEVLRAIATTTTSSLAFGMGMLPLCLLVLDVRIDSNVTDLDKQEDVAVTHLALALEGRLGKLHASWKYFDAYRTNREDPAKMLIALREEIVTVFTTRLITALLHPATRGSLVDAEGRGVLEERLRFEYHDHLRNVLQDAGIGENTHTNGTAEASWVHDVGLAFLFYQESASASLSLREWYDSFSSSWGGGQDSNEQEEEGRELQ